MLGWVERTSFTRCAATSARGSMMEIIPMIKNDAMMVIEYEMNAIMSPVWMTPVSIYEAPTQMISTLTPFMMSIIEGCMNVMTRLVNSCVR